jgi:hypothetical protein
VARRLKGVFLTIFIFLEVSQLLDEVAFYSFDHRNLKVKWGDEDFGIIFEAEEVLFY